MLNDSRVVYIARFPIDFRYGANKLLAYVLEAELSPQEGDVVVFSGKNKKRLKILHGDSTGIWLSLKIFTSDEARARVEFLDDQRLTTLSSSELALLLEGLVPVEALAPGQGAMRKDC